ncbi:MAG: hypothetical protein IPL27_27925 [Lewinellaceae bacterium]|nr:hypothetical protein [Lewinellaceae bacterium]
MSQLRQKVFMTDYGKRFGVKGNDRLETAQDRLTILLNVGLTRSATHGDGQKLRESRPRQPPARHGSI